MIITVTLNPALDVTYTFSCFSEGKTNRPASVREDIGGKGINVSKHLLGLLETSLVTGFLAGENGKKIREAVEKLSLPSYFYFLASGNTRKNTKMVSLENKVQTEINEQGAFVSEEEWKKFSDKLFSFCSPQDAVIISGSLPPGITIEQFGDFLSALKEKEVNLFLDTSKEALKEAVQHRPFFIKPNREELEEVLGISIKTEEDCKRAGTKLIRKGVKHMILSLGSEGSFYISEKTILHAKKVSLEVKSCVGAGDAMVAAAAYAFLHGYSESDLFTLAVAASMAAVTKEGTQAITMEECKMFCQKVSICV